MKVLSVLVLFVSTFAGLGAARRVELLRLEPRQAFSKGFIPIFSSVEDFAESLAEGTETPQKPNPVTFGPFESVPEASQELRNVEPTVDDSVSSGRTFKHFLLLRSLINSDSGSGFIGGGGNNGFVYPIIINTPLNFTNLNNNTLTNAPAAPAAPATPAAPTRVAFTGGSGGGEDVRINFIGLPQMQQWPMQLQMPLQDMKMPTQVYHQRDTSNNNAFPYYTVAMLNMPGTSPFMPITQHTMSNNYRKEQRKVLNWPNRSNRNSQNPFTAFANSFRGIQFL